MAKEQSPTTTVTIRVENDILDSVKKLAASERRSINAEINVLLEEALKERMKFKGNPGDDEFPY